MLQTVRVSNDRGEKLVLKLEDVVGGVYVKSIDGLDPVKATIVTSDNSGRDGIQYQNSRRDGRNIVFKLGMEASFDAGSIQTIRSKLMGFFMTKSRVTLEFIRSEAPSVSIEGRVEDSSFPLFARDPEGSVSILCFNPDFEDKTKMVHPGETNIGNMNNYLDYEGTVETGFVFQIFPTRSIEGFSVFHKAGDDVTRLWEYKGDLVRGDKLEFNSTPGSKRVVLTRNGVTESVLYGMTPTSDWLELYQGRNNFVVVVEGTPIPYSISYTNKFGSL